VTGRPDEPVETAAGDGMGMRVLSHDSYPEHPWRNGRGILRHVADGEGWQLRLADIAQSGPFSDFSGCLRQFAMVQGSVVLRMPSGLTVACDPASPVAVFDGGAAPECDLVAGPARAFNLISEPAKVGCRLERQVVGEAPHWVAGDGGALVAIHVQSGAVECLAAGDGGADRVMPAAGSTCLARIHDTIVGVPADGVRLRAAAASGGAVVLVMRIAPRAARAQPAPAHASGRAAPDMSDPPSGHAGIDQRCCNPQA